MERESPQEAATSRSRGEDPRIAEAMAHAMKPHMDDAHQLEVMADEAYAQSKKRQEAEKGMLVIKSDDLDQAARSSRFAADEAAERARRDQLDDSN